MVPLDSGEGRCCCTLHGRFRFPLGCGELADFAAAEEIDRRERRCVRRQQFQTLLGGGRTHGKICRDSRVVSQNNPARSSCAGIGQISKQRKSRLPRAVHRRVLAAFRRRGAFRLCCGECSPAILAWTKWLRPARCWKRTAECEQKTLRGKMIVPQLGSSTERARHSLRVQMVKRVGENWIMPLSAARAGRRKMEGSPRRRSFPC